MCWARANEVTEEIANVLKAMNMRIVAMGLESGCQRTLDSLKGHVTVEQNEAAINYLKKAGIMTTGSFVIGSPHETEAEITQTYKFIKRSRLDFMLVQILRPRPGTPCWEYWTAKNPLPIHPDWSLVEPAGDNPNYGFVLFEELSRTDLYRLYNIFVRLARSMSWKAHLRKLRRLSEYPQIIRGLLSWFRQICKRLMVRHRFR